MRESTSALCTWRASRDRYGDRTVGRNGTETTLRQSSQWSSPASSYPPKRPQTTAMTRQRGDLGPPRTDPDITDYRVGMESQTAGPGKSCSQVAFAAPSVSALGGPKSRHGPRRVQRRPPPSFDYGHLATIRPCSIQLHQRHRPLPRHFSITDGRHRRALRSTRNPRRRARETTGHRGHRRSRHGDRNSGRGVDPVRRRDVLLPWLSCFRRLQVRWDRDSGCFFAFVLVACALVCFNRL
jgi:hypothetical protein